MKTRYSHYFLGWLALSLLMAVSFAQTPPPDPDPNPATEPAITDPQLAADLNERLLSSIEGTVIAPVGGNGTEQETADVMVAVTAYNESRTWEETAPLEQFLTRYPSSAYRISVLVNLGYVRYEYGFYSRALDYYQQAWALAKAQEIPKDLLGQAVVADAGARLAGLYARLGRRAELGQVIDDLDRYPKAGTVNKAYELATQGLVLMNIRPGTSYNCGPYALFNIAQAHPEWKANAQVFLDARATPDVGFSLAQLQDLATQSGLHYVAAKRTGTAEIPLPAVAHWKSGHYAAILEMSEGRYHVKDPTFVTNFLMSPKAMADESSGYFLIPQAEGQPLPQGWELAGEEAAQVFGRGVASSVDPKNQSQNTLTCSIGMPVVSYNLHEAEAYIVDTPLSYQPPVGPAVSFQISYFEGQIMTPAPGAKVTANSTWTMNYLSAVQSSNVSADVAQFTADGRVETYTPDNSSVNFISATKMEKIMSGANITGFIQHYPDGSAKEFMQKQHAASGTPYYFLTGVVDPQGNRLTLAYNGTTNLLTSLTDALGQNTTFTYNGTSIRFINDPFGRSANLTYNAGNGRLTTIADPVAIQSNLTYIAGGFVSNLHTPYGNTAIARNNEATPADHSTGVHTLLITDPFGSRERLSFCLTSNFTPATDAVDPSGYPDGQGHTLSVSNIELNTGVTIYHSKKAMSLLTAATPGADVWLGNTDGATSLKYWQFATIYKWAIDSTHAFSEGVPQYVKPPLENATWYLYEGQPSPFQAGNFSSPSAAIRMIKDQNGSLTSQVSSATHNALGNLLTLTDPVGRTTLYTYDANGQDLLTVQQTTAADYGNYAFDQANGLNFGDPGYLNYNAAATVATYANYTAHLPQSFTGPDGMLTTMSYDGNSSLIETNRYASADTSVLGIKTKYNRTGGYVTTVQQSVPGDAANVTTVLTMDYPAYGLPGNITDAKGYKVLKSYDGNNRQTQLTYPDSTTEVWNYTNTTIGGTRTLHSLSLGNYTDREGQTTVYAYDEDGHVSSMTDPASRKIIYNWCTCGSLTNMTVVNATAGGNATTSFAYDLESRRTSKTITTAGVTTNVYSYAYEPESGRLASMVLPNDQGANTTIAYTYNLDDSIAGLAYGGANHPANVTYAYDPMFNRLTQMTDGLGTSNYTYGSVGNIGALQLTDMNGPWDDDTLHYDHDALGRLTARQVVADNTTVLQSETYALDTLNRITTLGGDMGNFVLGYNGASSQLTSVAYPNGLNTTFGYLTNSNGAWLANITNNITINATTTLFSQFDYTRRGDGLIATWQQQFGWAPNVTSANNSIPQNQLAKFTYDGSGWLTGAELGATNTTTNTTLKDTYEKWTFGYDNAGNGNLTSVSGNDSANTTANITGNFNSGNQLLSQSRNGKTRVAGVVDKPAAIEINGREPRVWSLPGGKAWAFDAALSLSSGTQNVTLRAIDGDGHTTSQVWKVQAGGTAANYTYDANGNVLTQTSEPGTGMAVTTNCTWDSVGQLLSLQAGSYNISFAYDGLGRRVQLTANIGGSVTNEYYLWDGDQIVQKRMSGTDAANITTKFFGNGFQTVSGGSVTGNYYYTKDHLGSIREVVAGNGTLEGRFSYGPWGETVYMDYSGGAVAQPQFAYAGYFQSRYIQGAYFTKYRMYDVQSRRWLSRDPIGEDGGMNLYGYVGNNPIDALDPDGLKIEYANTGTWSGAVHSYIIITPDNQDLYKNDPRFQRTDSNGKRYATIGGDRAWRLNVFRKGRLYGYVNNDDSSCAQRIPMRLPGGYKNEDEAIKNLFKYNANFDKNVDIDYTALPTAPGQYNSNSYTSGLGTAAGFLMPNSYNINGNAQGTQYPIPRSSFY